MLQMIRKRWLALLLIALTPYAGAADSIDTQVEYHTNNSRWIMASP